MPDKLCVQWNDFQENQKSSFGNLRKEADFANVTLACEDGEQFSAHKLVLASSSPLLKKLLQINIHPHPLIYLRGVKSEDLAAIMDFIYLGKANILHENVEPFLAIAEDLGLKGFWDPTETEEEADGGKTESKKENILKNGLNTNVEFSPGLRKECESKIQKISIKNEKVEKDMTTAKNLPELKELDEKVKALMEKGQNRISVNGHGKTRRALVCKICGKEGQFVTIRDHIESNHLEGVLLPCNICGKRVNSRHSLSRHKKSAHMDKSYESDQKAAQQI